MTPEFNPADENAWLSCGAGLKTPDTSAESMPVSMDDSHKLAEIMAQSCYPLVRQYLTQQRAETDTYLWREGDSGESLALVLSGKLETLKETAFPERPFVTGIFNAGAVVGEDGFLNGLPRSTTVRVLESCELLILTRESFEQLDQSHPAVANLILKWLLNLLSDRLHNAQERLATIF